MLTNHPDKLIACFTTDFHVEIMGRYFYNVIAVCYIVSNYIEFFY